MRRLRDRLCSKSHAVRFALALCAMLAKLALSSAPLHAQSAASDNYSLFNPTPDSALRSFSTDRPTKSNVPQTVDAGRFQYEMDLVNAYRQTTGAVTTKSVTAINAYLKVGLTSSIDLEVSPPAFQDLSTKDGATGLSTHAQGVNDTVIRLKGNLWGNEGGKSAFALIPFIKVPTATRGIGNGAAEGGIIAPLAFSLPEDTTLLFNFEVDQLKNLNDGGYHTSTTNLINLSRTIQPGVTIYGELWSQVNFDPSRTITQVSLDTAVAWALGKNAQIDVGANFGLTRDTPAVQIYTGLSQRF